MAQPNIRAVRAARAVSGNALVASASVHRPKQNAPVSDQRTSIAKAWQIEVYRHLNICGEARYAVTLYANMAGRAEIGVSEPQALGGKPKWVKDGPEVDAFAELVPDVRARRKLVRDFMLHYGAVGECYLIARERRSDDPGYKPVPVGDDGTEYDDWDKYLRAQASRIDVLSGEDPDLVLSENPNVTNPIWEIVAVTEIQRTGMGKDATWQVRYENGHMLDLKSDDPVIRMWNPDPKDRREAWSPMRALLPTLNEIEWETAHIFRQIRSRLMSAGVWFLPGNLTYPNPTPEQVEGGAEAIAAMNEAEKFMVSLAASGMQELDSEEVSFPTVVMADEAALGAIDQKKLIQFWSEIDDKVMLLRSAAVQRFALGWDLPPEQVLGSSGLAVTGSGGSAGSVNHWGVWANEEQSISAHIEPGLDVFTSILTTAYLQVAVEGTDKVVAYDTAAMRLRQDRSKEAIELYDRGLLNGEVTLRENGFDPENDKMGPEERKMFLLMRLTGGSPTPDQMQAALALLGAVLNIPLQSDQTPAGDKPGRTAPRTLEDHPVQGPPTEQHDHTPAPFATLTARSEGLVLRALEKYGNRLLNDGKRGREKDRTTDPISAHLTASADRHPEYTDFDFSTAPMVLNEMIPAYRDGLVAALRDFCVDLTTTRTPYSRDRLERWLR